MMNIHEFGKENNEIILLIHPSVVKWDYFENVIPLLQEKYHLLIPALPGYDFENDSDFTSVEQIASELNDWLSTRGYRNLYAVYGCSMGGSIALMVTLEQRIKINHCIMDGGITPYQLPWFVTRFIALKDYLMMMLGRVGGISLLEKAFATDEYSKEDLQYVVFCDIVAEKHYGVPLIPAIITEYLSLFRILTRKFITGVQKMRKKSGNRILPI